MPANTSFVTTIGEHCRMCYTCVRECPAKAIRISEGQAQIVGERCINCGNCVRVCSQRAKQVVSSVDAVNALLSSGARVAACLAPSFPAEFPDADPMQVVAMVRRLGFELVAEVAFAADLVADRYRALLENGNGERFISTPCPAIIAYTQKYHPELVGNLAPIVSPMVAMGRVLHLMHGDDLKVVFIGPCIAKKQEAAGAEVAGDVDAVLTFLELHRMFEDAGLRPDDVEPTEFDPPRPGLGALFPISRGLLQAAGIREDLLEGEIVAADGNKSFTQAIREFGSGDLDAQLLEILACTGCIVGAGMTSDTPAFGRRSAVGRYVRRRMAEFDEPQWEADLQRFADLDLSRTFAPNDMRIPAPSEEELRAILERLGKLDAEDELNCGACGYETCREHAIAIFKGLAENEMCLPNTIEQLHVTVSQLIVSNDRLANVQEALVHAEKIASMGQLAAGIAHEINNPLGVVLMYAHILLDEITHGGKPGPEDLTMIVEQADRCKKIVAGLLDFARQNRVVLKPTDLSELIGRTVEMLNLPDSVSLELRFDGCEPVAEVDRDQMVQVLTNLLQNALAAMPNGGELRIEMDGDEAVVRVAVCDTGCGIQQENLDKVFEPFFTTKQVGKGTGLGLAVTYGIVKMHRGDIAVVSNADAAAGPTGTTFTVTLPRKGQSD
jgi:two-component system NtrC family sensor kinase